VLDLSPGDITRRSTSERTLAAALAAAPLLGLAWRGNLHYPDGRLENALPARMTISGEIRRLKPRLVMLPYWNMPHPDHNATSILGRESCFLAGLDGLDQEGPGHRPALVLYYAAPQPWFVTPVTGQKQKACELFGLSGGLPESWIAREPLPLSVAALLASA
jgi:LmbE family N-acetylglucosaminyl deacetylase